MHAEQVLLKVRRPSTAVMAMWAVYSLLVVMEEHVYVQDLLELAAKVTHHADVLLVCMQLLMHIAFAHSPEDFAAEVARYRFSLSMYQEVPLHIRCPLTCIVAEWAAMQCFFVFCHILK